MSVWGYSSVVEHSTADREVPGSIPGVPLLFSLGQDTAELFFEDLRVPASAVLGGEAGVNRGFGMLMGELPRERLLIGVQAAATMEAAFEFTREYVNERKAFGKTIVSTFQYDIIYHKFIDLFSQIFKQFNISLLR